jgi:glycosyltransferase involved in cell wall biosynthesis
LSEHGSFGVNVIGFVSSKLGLGSAARMSVASLVRCGINVAIADIDPGEGRSGADMRWAHLNIRDFAKLPHPVNLVHINPVEAEAVRRQFPHWFAGAYNVIVPFYEPPRIPLQWVPLLQSYDLVLAASEHIASAIRNEVSTAVRHYPIGVETVDVSKVTREKYKLPAERFLFAMSFDTDSGLTRKNAVGAIQAFQVAFGDRPDVGLVIKVNGVTHHPALAAAAASLGDRVHLFDKYLPYEEVIGLYSVCDAYLSLHRAEGLGLGIMEAMALGKPVVTTGWSGNMDFTNEQNAALVRYAFTPVVDGHNEYSQQRFQERVYWAEPNLIEAAIAMRRVADDASYRERIGAAAAQTVAARNNGFFSGSGLQSILHGYMDWQWRRSTGIA